MQKNLAPPPAFDRLITRSGNRLERAVGVRPAFWLAVVVLIALALFSLYNVREAEQRSIWVEHTQEVRLQLEELINLYSRTRGLWRNYLAQGNPDDKHSHEVWSEALAPKIRALNHEVADNPSQLERLAKLDDLMMKDLEGMREGIALKAAGQLNDPAQALEEIAKLQMAPVEIRELIRQAQAEERQLLAQRREAAQQSIRLIFRLTVFGGGLSLIVLLLAFCQILRENAQRKTAEESVNALNADLERHAVELQGQRSELQDHLDSMSTLTVKIARDGTVLLANQTAREFGFVADLRAPRHFVDSAWCKSDTEARQHAVNGLEQAFAGLRVNFEEAVQLDDRIRDLSISLVPVRGADGGISYVVAEGNDITALKQAKQTLSVHAKRLEEANKELESFSYSVSHDLRAPLRAVDGYSRMLEEDYDDKLDDEGKRLLRVIRDNSRAMGHLIDDLLEFSRMGRKSLSLSMIDMAAQAQEAANRLIADGNITGLKLEIGPLQMAFGDSAMIRQVWVNLLSNAIKFTGGRERPTIRISGRETEREYIYSVEDNGAGFDMRYADKLFCVFQRLHSTAEYPGTGVGLAIVQRIVVRHGGHVGAEGQEGIGATFWFALPKVEQGEGYERV